MYIHASVHMRTILRYNLFNHGRVIIRVCFRIVVAFHLPEFPNTSPIPMNNYIKIILEDENNLSGSVHLYIISYLPSIRSYGYHQDRTDLEIFLCNAPLLVMELALEKVHA